MNAGGGSIEVGAGAIEVSVGAAADTRAASAVSTGEVLLHALENRVSSAIRRRGDVHNRAADDGVVDASSTSLTILVLSGYREGVVADGGGIDRTERSRAGLVGAGGKSAASTRGAAES